MSVGVDGQGDAVFLSDALHQEQVALGGLPFLEDSMGRCSRGIVDGQQ